MVRLVSASVFSVALAFAGCSTSLSKAGKDHALVVNKWHALAAYADSKLAAQGVTVTARLSVTTSSTTPRFAFNAIGFSTEVSPNRVNLLSPAFDNKSICLSSCYSLTEYTRLTRETGSTLLVDFFARHEFELFQFYADLVVFSDELQQLIDTKPDLARAYFTYLAQESQRFGDLSAFTQYLSQALGQQALAEFISSNDLPLSPWLQDYYQTPEAVWNPLEQPPSLAPVDFQPADKSWFEGEAADDAIWINTETEVTANWSTVSLELTAIELTDEARESVEWLSSTAQEPAGLSTESALWLSSTAQEPVDLSTESVSDDTASYWLQARGIEIRVGDNVCSYADNKFGKVLSISAERLLIEVLGAAIEVKDGVLATLPAGALFSGQRSMSFIPETNEQFYPRQSVARCSLK